MNFTNNIILLMNVKWIKASYSIAISCILKIRKEIGSIVKLFKQSIVPRNGSTTNCVRSNMHPDVAGTHTFCPLSSGAVSYTWPLETVVKFIYSEKATQFC